MAQLFRRRHHSPEQWLRRLNRAAERMNPFLALVAIGLVILNLTCVTLIARKLPSFRLSLAAACPAATSAPLQHDVVSRPF